MADETSGKMSLSKMLKLARGVDPTALRIAALMNEVRIQAVLDKVGLICDKMGLSAESARVTAFWVEKYNAGVLQIQEEARKNA
jgi:hypothetical protein